MAKNELLPFADGEDANVLPTNQWEALTDILENGFQSGIARSEQVNRVLAQGAVASYVLGQLIVDQLNKDATLDKDTLYQNLILALQENAKDACLPLSGGTMTGKITTSSDRALDSTSASGLYIVADASVSSSRTGTLSVFPVNHSQANRAGGFQFVASDGTSNKALTGSYANGLTWDGNKVITSAGGTFSGTIVTSNTTSIRQTSATSGLGLRGGTTTSDGAYIGLYGKDSSEAGMFTIASSNGSKIVRLQGYADGKLTWNGNVLVHVVKTWKSGFNWYRKWSDGWIEQGGYVEFSDVNSGTITFNTAFTSQPTVAWGPLCTSHGEFTLSTISASNFTWKINSHRSGGISWYACGY